MLAMLVTKEVSQPPMSWLKEAAPKNIRDMSVTEEVSQAEMS